MRRALTFALRARSVDVLTAAEANMINRQDEDHLDTADYCAPHQRWKMRLISRLTANQIRDRVEFISSWA